MNSHLMQSTKKHPKAESISNDKLTRNPQDLRTNFLLEWEYPLKCEKCGTRFKGRQKFREHKSEVHAY
jgi:hypothetical protein